MIYLNAEKVSGLGEDTFWTWFHREFPTSVFDVPKKLRDEDMVLRYSTLGFLPVAGKQVALCWELYPDMRDRFDISSWDDRIAGVHETARYATYRTVASHLTREYYERFGSVEVIPIGVNTELFRSIDDKAALREKYALPQDREIGVWVGTAHPMKGFTLLREYARAHPDIHWVTICKTEEESVMMPGATRFVKAPQATSCELINAGDFFLSTSLLKPFYMAEWEAMACDAEMRLVGEPDKEFVPTRHPRQSVFDLGWDRDSVKRQWERFLSRRGVEW